MDVLPLTKIFELAENRTFRIPNFQRDFVWGVQNTETLIDSMIRQYPIGNFLLLNCGNEKLQLDFIDIDVDKNVFEDKKPLDNDCYYVLDGQQRITSLIRSFFDADNNNLYCLNLTEFYKFLYDKEDAGEDNLITYLKKGSKFNFESKNKKLNHNLLPLYEIKNSDPKNRNKYIRDFISKNPNLIKDEEEADDFKSRCSAKFTELINYGIPVQKLDNKTSLESIVRIFETINNTGVKLSVFDLMVAKTFIKTDFFNFNLKQKLLDAQKLPLLEKLQGETLLNAILYANQLVDGTYIISTKTKLLELTNDEITQHFDGVLQGFSVVEKWLIDNNIKYSNFGINLKIMLAISEYKYSIFNGKIPTEELKKFILYRWFDDTPYNRGLINEDILMFKAIFEGSNFKMKFLDVINYDKKNASDILEITNKSKEFPAFMCIFNANITYDIGNKKIDILKSEDHHIIPDAYIKLSFHPNEEMRKRKDSIANFVWTTPDTNNEISNNHPMKYFNEIIKNNKNNLNELQTIFKNSNLPIDPVTEQYKINDYFHSITNHINFLNSRAIILANFLNEYYSEYMN